VTAAAFDGEFLRHMKNILLGMLPINVAQAKALEIPIHGLRQAFAQAEQVENAFVGAQQTDGESLFEHLHGGVNVGLGKRVALTVVLDFIVSGQPVEQNTFQQDGIGPPATQRQRLTRGEVNIAQVLQQVQRR